MFPEREPRETLRFEGSKMNCFQRDQSLSDLLYPGAAGNFKAGNSLNLAVTTHGYPSTFTCKTAHR